jgi:hypothetical protein
MRRTVYLQVAVIGWSLLVAVGAIFATTILSNEGARSVRAAELASASELLVATERLHGHALDAVVSIRTDGLRPEQEAFTQLAGRVARKLQRHADITAIERDVAAFSHELDRTLARGDRAPALDNLASRRDALEHDLDRLILEDRDALADASASARTALTHVRTALGLFAALGVVAAAALVVTGRRPQTAVAVIAVADVQPAPGRPQFLK